MPVRKYLLGGINKFNEALIGPSKRTEFKTNQS